MNLGAALSEAVRGYADARVKRLAIEASGCPNSCGQHWIGDIGFYGNARKIGGKEVPYYQMLLGGGIDEDGVPRFGLAVQSVPARLRRPRCAACWITTSSIARRTKPSANTCCATKWRRFAR